MLFIHTLLVNVDKSKQNNQNPGTLHFETAIYRVLHERSNHTASFTEHLKLQEKVNCGGCTLDELYQIKKTRIWTLYILKLIHN